MATKSNLSYLTQGIALLLAVFFLSSCVNFEDIELREVSNFQVDKSGGKGMTFNVELKVYNPNQYKIALLEHDMGVSLNGTELGRSTGNEKYILGKQEEKAFKFSVQAEIRNIFGGLLTLLPAIMSKDEVDVRVQGKVKAKAKGIRKSFDVDYTTQTSLSR